MGLFDRIKKKHEDLGKDKKPMHVSDAKEAEKKSAEAPKGKKPEKIQKTEEKHEKAKIVKQNTRDAYRVLLQPLQTEKASRLAKFNQFVFVVPSTVSKIEVSQALKALYGVHPVKITCVKVHGKAVRFGRTKGKQKDWKKAFVKLKSGETIDTSS
ncbi:MAG: 50S ribosomal protein L23 [Candidatus Kerfeldbacteria bacterium CG08_land_8_20_14_0_20_43_14]|uniref:Large ribosomal subunit protein uL23 n=1 Tax=Candidatus Kerfeldbacteria bacterium CG08_land_8_20_14_0_20_43_14 TaxID=2014246 RepID=A0A2H0YPT8_9BACT|nr:MAG: 50S ribosomal protein L23 [Candidatus Kerfeldbacteria bacterium CG08_land_8_20_14_0_20_43_14]